MFLTPLEVYEEKVYKKTFIVLQIKWKVRKDRRRNNLLHKHTKSVQQERSGQVDKMTPAVRRCPENLP